MVAPTGGGQNSEIRLLREVAEGGLDMIELLQFCRPLSAHEAVGSCGGVLVASVDHKSVRKQLPAFEV